MTPKIFLRTVFFFLALAFPLLVQGEDACDTAQFKAAHLRVTAVEGRLGLYNPVTVEIKDLPQFLASGCKEPKNFVVYVDWRPLRGVVPTLVDSNKLRFDIRRTPESKDQWDALLGRPFSNTRAHFAYYTPESEFEDYLIPVVVTVGYDTDKPIPSDVEHRLILINGLWMWIYLALFLLTIGCFVWLARNTNIIRNPLPQLPVKQRPYSLSHSQMAFWLFVVSSSYSFILLTTGDHESIPGSILVLLGISAATALSAKAVDSSKRDSSGKKREALEVEGAGITAHLESLQSKVAAADPAENMENLKKDMAEKNKRMEYLRKEIQTLRRPDTPPKSDGFIKDIFTDADGISLHRFQIVVWTCVLGITFAVSIYNTLAMPQFSETLLALMGISNGTYVGFKFPEKMG